MNHEQYVQRMSEIGNLAKYGKVAGIAGTVLTVGGNAVNYFGDGVQGNDVPDFIVDTGVDLAGAAVGMGVGAAVGSFVLQPALSSAPASDSL